jgi:CubicO group peptidase (beta-lactamase class C family)
MMKFVEDQTISGSVTVVGTRQGIVHFEAVGQADLAANKSMAKDTVFRIMSMTKPVTAMGLAILADEGKLSFRDPVMKHLPEFTGQMIVAERGEGTVTLKKPTRPITLHDLLTHTSGLPGAYPPGVSDVYMKRNRTLAETAAIMSQRPLEFEPGSKWAYCNTGIDVLGRVIEVCSGMSYEAFLKQRIFDPLGMKDTTFSPTREQMDRQATVYSIKDGKLAAGTNLMVDLSMPVKHPVPAGGLYSTGADLAKLYQMTLNGGLGNGKQIISEKNMHEITTLKTGELKTGFVDGMGFGYGFAVVREPKGVTAMLAPGTFGHGGAYGTQGWIDPKAGRYYILLIQRVGLPNGDASPMRKVFQELAAP